MIPPRVAAAFRARGWPADKPEAIRAAVTREIDVGRREGLSEILDDLGEIDEFAAWARAQRARLHRIAGEFAQALGLYDELFRLFAERATPHWAVGRARCLMELDRLAEAERRAREGIAAFPNAAEPRAFLARLLTRLGRDAEALEVWRALHAEIAAPDLDAWLGLAAALKACDGDAAPAQAEILARWPGEARALRALAALADEYGETAQARELRQGLLAALGEAATARDWAALARAHYEAGDAAAGAAALAQLERRFPESGLAEAQRLWLARKREAGLDEVQTCLEAALSRRPGDFELRNQRVQVLLAHGRLDAAEAETAALEQEESGEAAFAARLKLEAYRGDSALHGFLASKREFSAAEACLAARALLELRTPEAFARGEALVDEARRRRPDQARLRYFAARFAIARRDDERALELIDAFPRANVRRDILELRAWAEARRGRDEAAKAIWAQATRVAALPGDPEAPRRIGPDLPPRCGVTAFVAFRNEATQIADFLAHHRRLGVRRFVLFDHASDDESRALALREPDVVLYDCPGSFQLSACGRRWMGEVIAREGARGWGLQVDMDERLVYPGCETWPLDRLVGYLERRGFEAVRGFMLDLYPRRLIDANGRTPGFAAHRFWDDSYFAFGTPRPPYVALGGGVRARLFEAKEYLYKVPLWRLDAGALLNPHETTHLRFADVSAALLHYKMMNLALRGSREAQAGTAFLEADADIEAIRSHSRYSARLAGIWTTDLTAPGLTRELTDSWGLVKAGLMEAAPEYRDAMRGSGGG